MPASQLKKLHPVPTLLLVISVVAIGSAMFLLSGHCFPAAALCHSTEQSTQVSEELAPRYLTYSDQALAEAQRKGQVVLYFWAPWCSSCTSFDIDIQDQKQYIPDQVIVLRVPYDSFPELKKKYNVTVQHTFVQISNDGQLIHSWVGGGIENFSQYLR